MNLDKLMARKFPALEYRTERRDCILYALGIGASSDPLDSSDLQFTYEQGLRIFPSMVNVICHPGGWVKDPELEINWIKLLHGEQRYTIFQPLQPDATYVGAYRITDVIDKGAGKSATLYAENQLREKATGVLVCTVTSNYVLRGDGGSGGTCEVTPEPHELPKRRPDETLSLATLPQAALIYRLSGDYNPIHADPVLAQKAGFDKPILHGQCTLGIATRAILRTSCDQKPELLRSVQVRFSSPVYPGETLTTEIWRDDNIVSFRVLAAERAVTVLNNGRAEINL
jgi:acyl dehydratase